MFPQFQPRPLLSSEESHSSLFRVVAHEHRYKKGQDEDGSEQVEHNEEQPIFWLVVGLRLHINSGDAHRTFLDVGPSLLGHNLEQDEEGVAEVVEVVIGVRRCARCEDVPIIRGTEILAHAGGQVASHVVVITLDHFAIEQVDSINGKRDQETHRDSSSLAI